VPRAADFALVESAVEPPAPGEVLLRNRYLAMDPAIRNVLGQGGAYAAPLPLGAPVRGMVLGEVVASADPYWVPGDLAWGFGTWSDLSRSIGAGLVRVPAGEPLEPHLHQLGTIGLTAAYGLFEIAGLRAGDSVFVTGAAGAVGSLVGQLARAAGAGRVVGVAGGAAKCARAVERYGYDLCLDYKAAEPLDPQVAAAFPDGIDVVFDNVGGDQLELAIEHIAKDGRIALCGMISGYGATTPQPGPANLWNLVARTAQMRGFRVTDILADPARLAALRGRIGGLLADGKLHADLDVRTGLEAVPEAFAALFDGSNAGRLLVRLA
ncbi:MAG: NADP-dependent oxidoreductase, partial [Sphingomonadales bacterium]|nr:NADP-dependent oxidoreductase [Sphingomonadales bacterium]